KETFRHDVPSGLYPAGWRGTAGDRQALLAAECAARISGDAVPSYETARNLLSARSSRSPRSALEAIGLPSNQSIQRFGVCHASPKNQAKHVLLGARRPCQP